MSTAPRLTIGLPVYNGQNYVSESLDSLLAQTYTDFELIISDNASTDDTQEICRDYATRDSRIRYVRQDRNIGAVPNHNYLVQEARGELFKWAGHDDFFAPELVRRCIDALDDRPHHVLSHSFMGIIDGDGEVVEKFDYTLATDSPFADERFRSLLETDGGDDFYGVIRTDVLRRITPQNSFHNGGRKLVAELSLWGPFYQVPQTLFFRRDHPERGDRLGSIRAVCTNLDPRRSRHSSARLVGEYVVSYVPAIRRAPLSSAERRRCYRHYAEWAARRVISEPPWRTR